MTTLYIAGPMTGIKDWNFPAFNRAAEVLRSVGYKVENPADTGLVDGWSWEDYLTSALQQVLRSDGIAVLPQHEMSKGARLETHVAFALGKPVYDVDYWFFKTAN